MSSLDELYDDEHKPRLEYARSYFLGYTDRDPNLEGLKKFYVEWRDYNEYILLQKQTESLKTKGEFDKKTYAVKCSKRGNDVYWWRVGKRLKFLNGLKDNSLFDSYNVNKLSNILFVTLTYDVKKSSIRDAWENIGEDFNKWIRNLRKKYGRISHLRCWEASRKGYPHIHVLMIFHDYKFRVKRIKEKYRVLEKEEFEKSYHSFVDVQAIREVKEGIRYITKYLTKTKNESKSQNLTLAMCWLFRKRSFAVSGDLYGLLREEIKRPSINVSVQTDIQGVGINPKVKCIFIGVFSAKRLSIDRNEWSKTITNREVLSEIPS